MMDAVEFLRERRRMCNAQDNCGTCPIGIVCDDYFVNHNYSQEKARGMVSTVEQWAKEHPAKTRQSVFLEQYPETELSQDGILTICPSEVSAAYRGKKGRCKLSYAKCADCRRKFWLAEVEE